MRLNKDFDPILQNMATQCQSRWQFSKLRHGMTVALSIVKFIYSEKAKHFCKISTIDLTATT